MKNRIKTVVSIPVLLILTVIFSVTAMAYSGYDYTSNSELADKLTGIMNGTISIFDGENGYAVGTSIGTGSHSFGGTSGWTCWAYANAVYYKMFGIVPEVNGSAYAPLRGATSISFDLLTNAGVTCGTYMRTTSNSDGSDNGSNGHSIIVLSYNANNLTFLDCNWSSDSVIKLQTRSWAEMNNYFLNYKSRKLGRVTIPNGNPSAPAPADAWVYRVATSDGLNMRRSASTSASIVMTLRNPITITVTQKTNADGYTWGYGTSSNGYSGWIVVDNGWTTLISSPTTTPQGSEMSTGHGQPIADGDYLIASAANQKYYLDIDGAEHPATNCTNVHLCGELSGTAPDYDLWTVSYIGNGFYTIKQKGTQVSLEVADGSVASGANIQAYSSNGSSAQAWAISAHPNGGYRVQAKCSGYSLDITNGNIAYGTNIQQCVGNDSNAQAWVFIPYAAPGKPNVTVQAGNTYKETVFSWDATENTTHYNIYITDGDGNDFYPEHSRWQTADKRSYSDILPSGDYTVEIYAYNDENKKSTGSGRISFTVPYDIPVRFITLAEDLVEFDSASDAPVALAPIFVPNNATDKTLVWRSDNEDVAAVDEANGLVTPRRPGAARIWCESPEYGLETACNVIVHGGPVMKLPDNLHVIQEGAFENTNVCEIIVPDGVEIIESGAFTNCKNLSLVWVPESLTDIAEDAFDGCGQVCFVSYDMNSAIEYGIENDIYTIVLSDCGPFALITFNANGGTSEYDDYTVILGDAIGDLPEAWKDHCTFLGWYDEEGNLYSRDSVCDTVDLTLYAHWQCDECTVLFNANGGACDTSSMIMNQGEAIGVLPSATRSYYTLEGWYTDPTDGANVTTATTFAEDTTLYAHWRLNDFGEWSGWSTNPVSATDHRQVQTEARNVQTGTRTIYNYNRFLYWRPDYGYYMASYGSNWATSNGYSGSWQYLSTESRLPVDHTTDGQNVYLGEVRDGNKWWYNESTSSEAIMSNVTYYRYRDRLM